MITGIYVLRFNNTQKVYIGQSIDIGRRFTAHIRAMKLQKAARKLQEAFNTYGTPILEIVCESSREELDILEIEAINIFDSVKNGFNTYDCILGNNGQSGQEASNALHSNDTYIQVFHLCVEGCYPRKEIAEITGVSLAVVQSIDTCTNHKWLKEIFPKEYSILEDRVKNYNPLLGQTAQDKGIVYTDIVSPEGTLHKITSLRQFARDHDLDSGNLSNLLQGKLKTLKGWRLATTEIDQYPKIVDPMGVVYIIPYKGARNFAKEHNMSPGNLSMLLSGKKSQYLGWKVLNDTN